MGRRYMYIPLTWRDFLLDCFENKFGPRYSLASYYWWSEQLEHGLTAANNSGIEIMFSALNRQCFACFLVLTGVTARGGKKTEKSEKQPNIIFILADDLGWNEVSWHNSNIQTPYLQVCMEGSLIDH